MVTNLELTVGPFPRGLHEITGEVIARLESAPVEGDGLLNLFILHTSASLAITENASPDVPRDLVEWFDSVIPEDFGWAHSAEGPDDMPAHVKSVVTSTSLTIPVVERRPVLGTWQGIFLCEHRDHGGPRRLMATLLTDDLDQ